MQNKRACELKDKYNVHESEWKDPNKKFLHLSHTGLSRLNWNVKWLQNPRYLCLC